MAKNKSEKKVTKIGVSNLDTNRQRRLETEATRCQRMLDRLLKRHADGKSGGIKEGGERHKQLEEYIASLRARL